MGRWGTVAYDGVRGNNDFILASGIEPRVKKESKKFWFNRIIGGKLGFHKEES